LKIDKHSATWKAVTKFAESEYSTAVEMLIADRNSDQQRGIIHVLHRLAGLADDPLQEIIEDTYR